MRRNIDAWWPYIEDGVEAVISSATGCGAQLVDYGKLLANDPAYADRAQRISELARDLGEVLLAEDLTRLGAGNKADAIAGVDLSDQPEVVSKILIDLAQRETMNQSKVFANLLVKELATAVPILRNTHRSAGFAVLKSPTVPSVLVELGYLSNKREEKLLRSKDYRRKLVGTMLKAIDGFFDWQQSARRL